MPIIRAMTFSGERLRALRKKMRLSQGELGERVGLSQGAISDLERGIAMETNKLLDLARVCGVSPDWLLGKEEAPLKLAGGYDSPHSTVVKLRPDEPTQQRFIREIDVRGGASYGGGISDEAWQDGDASSDRVLATWGLPSSFIERELGLSYDTTDLLAVRGDSMEDGTSMSLSSGDKVMIDRSDTDPRQGGIFAVFDGEGVIIKQVELVRGHQPARIICKSRNTAYSPIELTLESPVRIIGRVAGRFTRM